MWIVRSEAEDGLDAVASPGSWGWGQEIGNLGRKSPSGVLQKMNRSCKLMHKFCVFRSKNAKNMV